MDGGLGGSPFRNSSRGSRNVVAWARCVLTGAYGSGGSRLKRGSNELSSVVLRSRAALTGSAPVLVLGGGRVGGVEPCRVRDRRGRLGAGRAGGLERGAPCGAAAGHELPGLRRGAPGLWVADGLAAQVQAQAEQGQVPADPGGARAVLGPPRRVDDRDVLQLQQRLTVGAGGEPHLDLAAATPAGMVADHPRHLEQVRRLAPPDLATGVALQLVGPAQAEVTGDGQEPAADPLGVGDGIPDVPDRRLVAPPQHDAVPLTRGEAPPTGLAVDHVELVGDVDHVPSCSLVCGRLDLDDPGASRRRRSRLPRASSVPSASRCWSQERRKGSSHCPTSRRRAGATAYRRRVPSARTLANPLSRRTRRCCDTAGWEIPNSPWMTAVIAPDAP